MYILTIPLLSCAGFTFISLFPPNTTMSVQICNGQVCNKRNMQSVLIGYFSLIFTTRPQTHSRSEICSLLSYKWGLQNDVKWQIKNRQMEWNIL